jgi:hypothetical protein
VLIAIPRGREAGTRREGRRGRAASSDAITARAGDGEQGDGGGDVGGATVEVAGVLALEDLQTGIGDPEVFDRMPLREHRVLDAVVANLSPARRRARGRGRRVDDDGALAPCSRASHAYRPLDGTVAPKGDRKPREHLIDRVVALT